MSQESTNRRNVLRGVAAALTAGAAGCSAADTEEENTYKTVSEGDYLEVGDVDSVEVKEVYEEKGKADLDLIAGPANGNYSEGQGVLCDKTEEEAVGVYVESINYKEEKVEFRLEQDSDC